MGGTKITRQRDGRMERELKGRHENNSPKDGESNSKHEKNSPMGWTSYKNNSSKGWMMDDGD